MGPNQTSSAEISCSSTPLLPQPPTIGQRAPNNAKTTNGTTEHIPIQAPPAVSSGSTRSITSKALEREAKFFLDQKSAHPIRSASYSPTLEELKAASFSDYVRSVLFVKDESEDEESDGDTPDDISLADNQAVERKQQEPSTIMTRGRSRPPSKPTDRMETSKQRPWNDGIVKVTLPEGFWDQEGIANDTTARGAAWQSGTTLGDFVVEQPIQQHIRGIGGVYEYTLVEVPAMSLAEFRTKADAYQKMQLGTRGVRRNDREGDVLSDEDCDFFARKFWKRLGPTMDPALYGADMEGSLFGGQDCCGWNLERLDSCLQLLSVDTDGKNLPGVTTPYLYIGMWGSVFCAHTEDMNLLSINYLHAGAPKYWYAVKPEDAKRFESLAESHFNHAFRECREFLRHKEYLLSPAILKKAGIPFTSQIQRPGDAVITMPGGYHFGINLGFNVAEATNFAVPEWIPKGQEAKICLCRPHAVHIDMNCFQSLLKRYEDDVENASRLGLRKMSYRAWTMLEARRRKQAAAKRARVCEAPAGSADPNIVKAKKGIHFWVEVTKPLVGEANTSSSKKKKKPKRARANYEDDWRLASPIINRKSLKMGTKVLCLLPSKDDMGRDIDEEQCFAGGVIELDEGYVKVQFEGMLRKDDAWIAVDREKIFLDSGLQYYNEDGLPNLNITLPT